MPATLEPQDSYAAQALRLFAAYDDAEAIVDEDGRRFTYTQVHDQVLTMAALLVRLGLHSGKTIGVLVVNPPESIWLQLAAHLVGCRTAWVAPNSPAPFRRSFIDLARVDAFVYETRYFAEIGPDVLQGAEKTQADRGTPLPVFCIGSGGLGADLTELANTMGLADTMGLTAASFDPLPAPMPEPDSLFQTGGTTGEPKLVHHRHGFFMALHELSRAYLDSGQPRLRHLLVAGTWHVSSQLALFITLFTGGTLLLQEGLHVEAFLHAIEHERVTSTLLPPPMLYTLLDDPRLAQADCSSLVTFTVSGSAAAPARLAQAVERFGPVMRVTYGLTEAPFITALPNLKPDPAHPERITSCGLPYGDSRVQIRDDTGAVLPPGEFGEVWVGGSLIMSGYWQRPELTTQALDDGWLRTGDIGRLDSDGYLYLVDRIKDMVVTGRGSTNVYCRPIEDALLAHPQVRAAAVIGVPHEWMGEAVHAFVVLAPAPGASVTFEELHAWVAGQLNATWAPRSVDFVDALPLTESGKVDKKALRTSHQARRS